MSKGKIVLVGAGPGDPGLVTKRGMEHLADCDVVVYDRLVSEEVLNLVPKDCKKIEVGKRVGNHPVKQEEINQMLVRLGMEGKKVVRLKGGDSFVFGRGGEEVLALEEAGIPYELVPGVTSAIAVPELAGIPVTHRGIARSFHVITGHTAEGSLCDIAEEEQEFQTYVRLKGTLLFLMAMESMERIIQKLLDYGKETQTPAAVISKGGTREERIVRGTLVTISEKVRKEGLEAPAILVIGKVAELEMRWKEDGLLTGSRIGVTGTRHMVKKLRKQLEAEGARCYDIGCSKICKLQSSKKNQALAQLSRYTWLVFTSTNGVHCFFEEMREKKLDQRTLGSLKIAVIGPGTGETLSEYGYYADYMPSNYTTEDLAIGLASVLTEEDRVLILRAKSGSPELTKLFATHHVVFEDIILYEMLHSKERREEQLSQAGALDYVTFASAEGVRGFFHQLEEAKYPWLLQAHFVCIGEVTAKALREEEKREAIIAKEYTASGLVSAIMADWTNTKREGIRPEG